MSDVSGDGFASQLLRVVNTRSVHVDDYAAEVNRRFQRAVSSVKHEVRGLPHDAAVARLVEAMRQHDVFMPAELVRDVARQLSDPWWHLRHPLRAWREMRVRRPDTEGARLEAEANELSRRVESVADAAGLDYYSIRSRRTVDGQEHVVLVHPWSASLARRIVDAAAPIPVDVRPQHGK